MKGHKWMLAACLLPLILLFALPSVDIRSEPVPAVPLLGWLTGVANAGIYNVSLRRGGSHE